jgi:excisionase family DNA binding protein
MSDPIMGSAPGDLQPTAPSASTGAAPAALRASNQPMALSGHSDNLDSAIIAILNAFRRVIRDELNVVANRLAPTTPDWLSPADAAVPLGVTAKTVRKWVREGRLPAKKQGREVRLHRADVARGPVDPATSLADRMYEHLRGSHDAGLPRSGTAR